MSSVNPVTRKRCAVYCRVSTDERLAQLFNSIDAQREAGQAFITSQRAEGWIPVADDYEDGGFSGGNMERPALKRLMADIAQSKVDIVIVYKIDRLTRSLADFAKMVEVFDQQGVSFSAVTQQINSATSMGRLMLNVLLSFAQFEREVIGERIRDKVAASRKRGMWMGGFVPLGYDVRDRKLVVNDAEADLVGAVFTGFVETRSGTVLLRRLREGRATTKRGKPFTKTDIYRVLNNRVYLGEAVHKGTAYPGEHDAIVTSAQWEAAHAVLQVSPRVRRNQTVSQTPALLRGLIFGSDGRAMSPTHARGKRGQIYKYYVSQSVLKGSAADGPEIARVPAAEIETAVVTQVRALVRQPEVIVGTWQAARAACPDLTEQAVKEALDQLDPLWDELFPVEQARIIHLLVDRVEIGASGATVRLRLEGLTNLVRDLGARDRKEAA